nr:hypothetical protein [uncultured archaeon]
MGLHKTHRVNQGMHISGNGVDIDVIVRRFYNQEQVKIADLEIHSQEKSTLLTISTNDVPLVIREGIEVEISDQRRSKSTVHINYRVDKKYLLEARDYEPK